MELQKYDVILTALKLPIRLGCMPAERQNYQSAELDLSFEINIQNCHKAARFELDKTVCYLTASELAISLAASKEWDLIENFLSSLAQEFFNKYNSILKLQMTLRKYVVPGTESAGVSLSFSKSK
jgi:dihydroneopterin aldolase